MMEFPYDTSQHELSITTIGDKHDHQKSNKNLSKVPLAILLLVKTSVKSHVFP